MRPAKRSIAGTEMPASRGVQGPGEMTIRSGCQRLDLLQRDRVVAMDVDVGAQLAEILDEVPGEAVVVVDHQQHGAAIFMSVQCVIPIRTFRCRLAHP